MRYTYLLFFIVIVMHKKFVLAGLLQLVQLQEHSRTSKTLSADPSSIRIFELTTS